MFSLFYSHRIRVICGSHSGFQGPLLNLGELNSLGRITSFCSNSKQALPQWSLSIRLFHRFSLSMYRLLLGDFARLMNLFGCPQMFCLNKIPRFALKYPFRQIHLVSYTCSCVSVWSTYGLKLKELHSCDAPIGRKERAEMIYVNCSFLL